MVKQHFKSGKQVAIHGIIMLLVLMAISSCGTSQREKYYNAMAENDSLKQVINEYVPEITLPIKVGMISIDGYAICSDANGYKVRINCNPDDYKLGDTIQ